MESNRDAEAYRQSQPWADERVTGLQRGVNAEQASLQPMIPEAEPFTYRRRQHGLFQTG